MLFIVNDRFVAIWQPSPDVRSSHIILYELKSGNKTRIGGDWSVNEPNKDNDNSNETDYALICGNLSQNSKHLAVCDNKKQLIVFENNDNQWKQLFKTKVDRNCIKLVFAKNKNSVISGHKSGDVFEYQFDKDNDSSDYRVSGRLVLGHCSMLLDVMQSPDAKHLITCDRDEKIRVSRYPNSYNIETYCLGHKEFVSSIDAINETTLVSGSGDGSLRLWNVSDGKELNCLMCDTNETIDGNATKGTQFAVKKLVTNYLVNICNDKTEANLLSVCFYNQSVVNVYSIDSTSTLKLIHTLNLDEEAIDICFDLNINDILWILLPKNESPLNVYQINEIVTKSNIYDTILNDLNNNNNFVEQCLNGKKSGELEGLYKHWFNNVEIYLQKKSERQEVMTKKKKFCRF